MCEIVRDTCASQVPERAAKAGSRQGSQLNRSFTSAADRIEKRRHAVGYSGNDLPPRPRAEVSVQQFSFCTRNATVRRVLVVVSVAMKPSKMIGGDYSLELNGIFHTGQVEPASCFQRLFGSVQTGLILKDITLEVRAGEVMAILGSKGKTLCSVRGCCYQPSP